jgi:hypothetical protein
VRPPRNKNAQKNDGDRQQHPVLDGNTAQDYALLDKPVHRRPQPKEVIKKLFHPPLAGYCEKSRWRGLEGRADIRPDFHRDKPPIAAMGYR